MSFGIKMFQLEHDHEVGSFGVTCVKVVDDIIISCGSDQTTRLWDIKDTRKLQKFRVSGSILVHPAQCSSFDLNQERTLLAVAHGAGFSIWNFATRTKMKEVQCEDSIKVNAKRYNQSGTALIIGQEDTSYGKVHLVGLEASNRRKS